MPRDRQEHRKWELKRAWIKSKKVQGNCVQQRLLERYVGFHQRRERKSSRLQEEAWTILRDIRLALANRCGR